MVVSDNKNGKFKEIDFKDKEIPYNVLNIVSESAAAKYKVIVFEKNESSLKVAMVDPENIDSLNALHFISSKFGLQLEIFKISDKVFEEAFKGYKKPGVIIDRAVEDYEKEEQDIIQKKKKSSRKKEEVDLKNLGSAPITKIVDVILTHAIIGGASDVHIEPQEKKLRIRYRLDGDLHETFVLSKKIAPALVSRIKIMSNLKIDEKRKPQDGRLKAKGGDRVVDVRVSTLPTTEGEKVVMRILERESDLDSFEKLGLLGRNLQIIEKGIQEPYGSILVTGPTGSGKSTTIFTALRKLNRADVNIVTLEDPIEYKIPGVSHSQVRPDIDFTFASGLRSILRQDPDIIMVGEIRDSETAELATHAALTGHLVLSTLHTNDALGAIPRLVDMGVESFLVSSSLRVIIAQRLVRRICEHCREQFEPTEKVKKYILNSLKLISEEEKRERIPNFDPNNIKVWRGRGCAKCKNTGTKGRIAIFEVVECGPSMRKVIDDNLTAEALEEEFIRQKATLMREDGVLKALNGETTIEFVEEATSEETEEKVDLKKNEKVTANNKAENKAEADTNAKIKDENKEYFSNMKEPSL
jgi:type IV pilus assembly protein PilB